MHAQSGQTVLQAQSDLVLNLAQNLEQAST